MTQQSPPGWYAPPGALPGPDPRVKTPAARWKTLGTTCLALSVGELLYCLWRLVSPLFSHKMMEAQRGMLPSTAGGVSIGKMADAGERFMAEIQRWEMLRTLPFLLATAFLLWIALRLRKAEEKALFAARIWALWALGAVAISLLIQILVTVPATIAYQRAIVDLIPAMPTGAAAPFDVKQITSSITIISTLIGVAIGAIVVAAWPVALYFWASKLIRETVVKPA
jgi:hypothetical protein